MGKNKQYWFHVAAIATIAVWGTTFVSTKVLINHGLTPVEIFTYRFLVAYVGVWFFSPRKLFAGLVLIIGGLWIAERQRPQRNSRLPAA